MTKLTFAVLRRRMRSASALSPLGGGAGLAALLLVATVPARGQDGGAPAANPVVPVPGGATHLDYGANGVPVVKIATPDANGTSYNRYQAFNVDARGVVLNNSDKIVQSRLAGYIDGNAQLKASGGASLIINEVVAANPSSLRGYIEVAGKTADLVLANPYGISCNGCGFVNAPRVTLAAAQPLVDGAGALSGFRTATGTIDVSGSGLDATNARLDLFARAVSINAGLYADTVTASLGAGDITRDGNIVVVGQRTAAQPNQPTFALDVAALGGMYARSIKLIGTERGLGVNVAGDLAGLEQGVTLSFDGRISVPGAITAKTAVAIETTGALDVAGQIYGEGTTTLNGASLTGNGLIGSGSDLTITTSALSGGGTLAAGLTRDGRVTQAGTLRLDVGGAAALTGRVLARDAVSLTAGSIVNRGLASGGTLTLRTATLDNRGGTIDALTALDAQSGAVANVGGVIQSGGALTLTGSSLANERGAVLALGSGALKLGFTGAIGGSGGQIGGNGDVSVTAGSLGIDGPTGSITATKALDVNVDGDFAITGRGLVAGGGATTANVGGVLGVTEGGLQGGSALVVRAGSVTIGSGGQVSGGSVTADTLDAVTNAGLIASVGRVDLTAASLANTGTISGKGGTSVKAAGLFAQDGLVASDGAIDINAGAFISRGGTVEAGGALGVSAGSVALDRTSLTALGSGTLTLASRGALTAAGTRIGSNGAVAIGATTLALTDSRITALGALALDATAGDLAFGSGATIENGGDLTLTATGRLSHAADIVGRGQNLTLRAATIDNRGGAILHLGTGTLALTGTGAIDNSGGRIATNGALSLIAGTFANTGGTLTSAGGAGLTIASDLANENGLIAAGSGLTLRAGATRNAGGSIEAAGPLDVRLAALDGGTLVATGSAGTLTLDVRDAISGSVLVGAATDATVTASSLNLAGGSRLTAGGTLTVGARDGAIALAGGTLDAAKLKLTAARAILTGNGGLIQSTGTTTIAADSLITTGGRVVAGGQLDVTASALDNRNGLLASGTDGATFTVNTLANDRGTLGGDGSVVLTATSVDNGAGTLAAGGDLTLSTASLVNATGGQIWADRDARVTATGMLANRGSIAAARDLIANVGTLDGGSGAGAGTLAGGRLLDITSGGGTLGRLVAPTALTLGIAGDMTNAASETIATQGALTLNIGGSFTNAGTVQGGTAIGIATGGAIANQAGGTIIAPTLTLTAGTTFENQGLLNGGAVSATAAQIANGGAIFGDSVALSGTGGIVNAGDSAVIATRGGLLSLSSGGDIVNRDGALLYSLGNLAVTGVGGTGRAGSLQNLSSDIQAQGSIAIAATRLLNDRSVFTTEEALLSTRHVEDEDRRDREHRTVTEFDETVKDTRVTADSGAARIIGGNIGIDAASVVNHLSAISASGNLNVGAATVTNTAFTGYNTTTQVGTIKDEKRNCFLFICGDWDTRSTTPFTSVDALPTFTIPSTITAAGTLTIDAVSIDNLVLVPGGGTADIFAASARPGAVTAGGAVAVVTTGAVVAPGGAPGVIAGTAIDPTFGFAVKPPTDRASGGAGSATLDLGGLFQFASSSSQVLVQADPRFNNYDTFLSSDYFLDKLGYDPSRVQRRLGDGLYEQQLIANQLVALVGAQRLIGYGDNQGQYRALLDAGATFAKTYNLALGVSLSPTQMATLTSDIVLLVETIVQTPSGPQTVLAPRVYLTKAAAGDLTSGGAIIAGRDIQLRASDSLTNAGVIRASASGTLVGGTIVNSGRLDLGSRGIVSAAGDLIDRGGTITGGDLTLAAGRDLTLAPVATTRTVATRYYAGRSDQQVSLTTTTTNRGSDIAATGNLDLLAGRTLSVTGASAAAGGNLVASAGQNIVIGSATDSGTAFAIGREGKTQFKQTQSERSNVLSDLSAGGNVTMATPGALTVNGGTITAGRALTLDAGSIGVTGVVDSTQLQRDTLKKSGGFLSSTKTTTTYNGTDQSVVASTLSGNTVALGSTGDTRIAGSNVVADNGVSIAAGGAIDVGTLTATDTEAQSTRVKKSGLSIGGGGLFLGVAKNRNDVNTTSITNTGSLIGSTAGDVTLDAGRALTVTGSQVTGTGLTRLTGESVAIRNATDVTTTDTLNKSSSIGISVGAQSPVLSGLQGVRDSGRILGNANTNARTSAVAGLAGGLAAYNAADALKGGITNLAAVGVSFGVSSSKATSNTRDETNVASRIAGNDVAIAARGAGPASTIAVQGSQIDATRDLTLSAPGAITLRSATETDTLAQKNSSSGFSVGVDFGLAGGVTPNASFNTSKGNASGTDVRHAETTLTAGRDLTINTGGALTLQGAQVAGERVAVDAASLAIRSEQDTSTYASKQNGFGLSVQAPVGGAAGIAGNLSRERQNGDFTSVAEQSGIYAGARGYDLNVRGNTDLVGGVIASDAPAEANRLSTGTLTASDLANRERYSANSLSIGGGLGNIGKNGSGQADASGANPVAGIRTGIGTVSATPPAALGAKGSQSGTTLSGIAPGMIDISSGDAASSNVAAMIGRNTLSANAGALTQQYDANKREEIALGFAAAGQLANQTGTFLTEQGRKADQWTKANPDAAPTENPYATWTAGGTGRLVLTALNGAAGSNVTGSLGGLVQASAVNVLQGLGTQQVKALVDALPTSTYGSETGREATRSALQALTACAGSVAGGSGACGGAALGAAGSVVLNNLLSVGTSTATDADGRPLSAIDQQGRNTLIATIVAGIASGAGLDANAAVTSASIETSNNATTRTRYGAVCVAGTTSGCSPLTVEQMLVRDPKTWAPVLKSISRALGSGDKNAIAEIYMQLASDAAATGQAITDTQVANGVAAYTQRQGTGDQLASALNGVPSDVRPGVESDLSWLMPSASLDNPLTWLGAYATSGLPSNTQSDLLVTSLTGLETFRQAGIGVGSGLKSSAVGAVNGAYALGQFAYDSSAIGRILNPGAAERDAEALGNGLLGLPGAIAQGIDNCLVNNATAACTSGATQGLVAIGSGPAAEFAAGRIVGLAGDARGFVGARITARGVEDAAINRAAIDALSPANAGMVVKPMAAAESALGRASPLSTGLGDFKGTYTGLVKVGKAGPLQSNLAETFSGGRYDVVTLTQDTILYRAGTADQPLGQFFSRAEAQGVLQTRIDSAVPPTWPNGATSPLDTSFAVKIPAGTEVYVGKIGSQGSLYAGGADQIVVVKPWIVKGVEVVGRKPIK
ncbi:hemagglutinin repeat-containing protein [Sphingomonas sp. OK281]|uniref:two-partner secretion domain-containing protein n=1 Tax=Sphingomonas sp. OK281 TaxID=1881067 RepID=UPI0008E49A8B|nr:hemagglutinin repeat-containing protein [Sphingomonas sp. OK281]SFN87765.1 filamentous hemagglutinin [Sphingomonas sp. OK281]